jgi:hypothetical protein
MSAQVRDHLFDEVCLDDIFRIFMATYAIQKKDRDKKYTATLTDQKEE